MSIHPPTGSESNFCDFCNGLVTQTIQGTLSDLRRDGHQISFEQYGVYFDRTVIFTPDQYPTFIGGIVRHGAAAHQALQAADAQLIQWHTPSTGNYRYIIRKTDTAPVEPLKSSLPVVSRVPRSERQADAWLIPANPTVYDHAGAFKKYGIITWSFTSTVYPGDIVYARVSGTNAQTIYKCIVERVRVPAQEVIGSEFWIQPFRYDLRKQYVNLKLLDTASGNGLAYPVLHLHGLDSTNQAQEHLVEPLKTYIESFFETARDAEAQELADNVLEGNTWDEIDAALQALATQVPPERFEVVVQKIARDPTKAKLVKERKQYICEICGREPFIQKNGKPYAEADHIRPLGGATRGLDSPENIRCLCAQCHAIVTHGSDDVVKDLLRGTIWES